MLLTLTWIAHDVFEEVVLGPTVPKNNNKIIVSFGLEIQIYIIQAKDGVILKNNHHFCFLICNK